MIDKALPAPGWRKLSRTITGTSEVSAGRSTIASVEPGLGLGYLTATGTAIGLQAVGLTATAPL